MIKNILEYLEKLYPDAHCELTYNKDYELLIAIVLSAQTTDKRVNKVTPILFNKYNNLKALSNASLEDIEEIIKEIGTAKKKSIYIKEIATSLLQECNGKVPNNPEYLSTLKGVGRKTINVFLAEYYNVPAIAVDTHVYRVSKRLNLCSEKDTVKETEEKLMQLIPKAQWIKAHHQFIFFGRYHCKAKKPNCHNCQLCTICKFYNKEINSSVENNKKN